MKKLLKTVLIIGCFISCSVVSIVVKANLEGIYFCTCDLSFSEEKEQRSNKSFPGYGNSYIVISKDDDPRHKHLRHCFLLYGTEIDSSLGKLILYISAAAGYYRDYTDRGIIAGENWLLVPDERDQYVISCTPVVKEGDKLDLSHTVDSKDITTLWGELYINMLKNRGSIYDRDTNNCCTVAFNSLREVSKINVLGLSLDLSDIKKRNFNIMGRGIVFDKGDDNFFRYVEGGSRVIKDVLLAVPKVAVRKTKEITGSEHLEIEHLDDKTEL